MKKILIAASAIASALALTAAEYASVSFQTTGPDKYADGETVLDGECYALVWTADGVFEGLNVDEYLVVVDLVHVVVKLTDCRAVRLCGFDQTEVGCCTAHCYTSVSAIRNQK